MRIVDGGIMPDVSGYHKISTARDQPCSTDSTRSCRTVDGMIDRYEIARASHNQVSQSNAADAASLETRRYCSRRRVIRDKRWYGRLTKRCSCAARLALSDNQSDSSPVGDSHYPLRRQNATNILTTYATPTPRRLRSSCNGP